MNKLIPLIVLSCLLPLAVNARTLTATGDTLDHAESKIRQPARQIRRSFFPVDGRGPAARRTGERIPG